MSLKTGDLVMIIAGGNSSTRPNKGKVGKILRFATEKKGKAGQQRVIIEGQNYVSKHKKARTSKETSGKMPMEAPVHISNVMFYVEKLKKPVKLMKKVLDNGKKVRGYMDPDNKEFVQV